MIFDEASFLALIRSTDRLFRRADFMELLILLPRFPLSVVGKLIPLCPPVTEFELELLIDGNVGCNSGSCRLRLDRHRLSEADMPAFCELFVWRGQGATSIIKQQ